jgi:hypothetical protein
MELGESASPQDIIDLYNNYVEEGVPLVSYSEDGFFTNEDDDEIPTDVILDELNYAIGLDNDENLDNSDKIHIPEEYSGVRMELGESASPQDIIDLYNNYVEEGVPLVSYSEYGTEGKFYNEDDDEIPTDVILDELNYAIGLDNDEM